MIAKLFNTKLFIPSFYLAGLVIALSSCTHHTATQQYTAPPLIVSVTATTNGHKITLRALNPEIFFAGYTLYEGISAQDATAQLQGTPCSQLAFLPNLPMEYTLEASPPGVNDTGGLCKFEKTLTSGNYIIIRSQMFSVQMDRGTADLKYSPPSNAFRVP